MSSYQILRLIAFSGVCSIGKFKVQEMRLKWQASLYSQYKVNRDGWEVPLGSL